MGRKSSAKAQSSSSTPPQPPGEPRRSLLTPIVVGAAGLVVAVGVLVYSGSRPDEIDAPAAQRTLVPVEPAYAKFGPHKQANLPPIPFDVEPPVRPADVTRAAYVFAAEHPEVLAYTPCYCGCESGGHRGNDDCFVKSRAANGDVTEWEPHGAT